MYSFYFQLVMRVKNVISFMLSNTSVIYFCKTATKTIPGTFTFILFYGRQGILKQFSPNEV